MAYTLHNCYRRLGKYFLYGHFRKDTCKLFYIGIGTKQGSSRSKNYQRATAKSRRNPYWKNIINKTDYKVYILFESDSLEEIKNLEVKTISKYRDRLVNISIGGDYPCDKILNKKKVYKYSLDGIFMEEYESVAEAARRNNLYTASLQNSIVKNKTNTIGGFQWYYEFKGLIIFPTRKGNLTIQKGVRLYNDEEEYIFNSRTECANFIKRSTGRISDLLKLGYWKNYKIENYVTN